MKRWVLDWLFPPRCALCGRFLGRGEKGECLCALCRQREPFHDGWQKGKLPLLEGAVWVFPYDGMVRRGIHRFKYRGALQSGPVFADLLAQRVRESGLLERVDLVCYVPCHKSVKKKRGYEQAREIAAPLARQLGLPMEPLLIKIRNTQPMYRLTAAQRRANVLGAFALSQKAPELLGKRVLLVDDVLTTGSTLSECARVLRQAGAERVYGAAFARTFRKKTQEENESRRA